MVSISLSTSPGGGKEAEDDESETLISSALPELRALTLSRNVQKVLDENAEEIADARRNLDDAESDYEETYISATGRGRERALERARRGIEDAREALDETLRRPTSFEDLFNVDAGGFDRQISIGGLPDHLQQQVDQIREQFEAFGEGDDESLPVEAVQGLRENIRRLQGEFQRGGYGGLLDPLRAEDFTNFLSSARRRSEELIAVISSRSENDKALDALEGVASGMSGVGNAAQDASVVVEEALGAIADDLAVLETDTFSTVADVNALLTAIGELEEGIINSNLDKATKAAYLAEIARARTAANSIRMILSDAYDFTGTGSIPTPDPGGPADVVAAVSKIR